MLAEKMAPEGAIFLCWAVALFTRQDFHPLLATFQNPPFAIRDP
ncbi:Hypothetical protein EAG7_00226 [Klebsiella aerogenes]|nr:Hypothetical protein EAG7_00226 [Klebsiella aerogenes]CCG28838.1 hypothetical protein [Klebsiella aerogenes EA1509E]